MTIRTERFVECDTCHARAQYAATSDRVQAGWVTVYGKGYERHTCPECANPAPRLFDQIGVEP